MAVTLTTLAEGQADRHNTTTPHTTAEFTPAAGKRLVVLMGTSAGDDGGTGPPGPSLTILDSQEMSWDPIGDISSPGPAFYRSGFRAWISSPVPAAMPTTLTFGSGSTATGRFFWGAAEADGSDGTVAGLATEDEAPTDGGYTRTLAATPNASDATIFARFIHRNVSGLVMPAGWTSFLSQGHAPSDSGFLDAVFYNGFDSADVVITDTQTSGSDPEGSIDMAFIIKAGGPPPPVFPRRGMMAFAGAI